MNPKYALGMIETVGFSALVGATDAAAKAANVKIVTYQGADAGIVTIYIIGDVASVQAAVAVGEAEAKRVGQLRGAHVIARPDDSVYQMITQLLSAENSNENHTDGTNENDEFMKKTVNELRRLASSYPNFPLTSEKISSARKEDLVKHLSEFAQKQGGDKL